MKLPPLLLVIASADLFVTASWVRGIGARGWTVGQTVSTTSGPVTGHAAANQGQVSEYLGIPFAQAPIGDLRWEAPVVFNGTTEISGASFVGFCCLFFYSFFGRVTRRIRASGAFPVEKRCRLLWQWRRQSVNISHLFRDRSIRLTEERGNFSLQYESA